MLEAIQPQLASRDRLSAEVVRLISRLQTGVVVFMGLNNDLEAFSLVTRRQQSGAVDLFVEPGNRYVHPLDLSSCELNQIIGGISLST